MALSCPECSSLVLIKHGLKFKKNLDTGKRVLIQQYQCKSCGRITHKPIIEGNK